MGSASEVLIYAIEISVDEQSDYRAMNDEGF